MRHSKSTTAQTDARNTSQPDGLAREAAYYSYRLIELEDAGSTGKVMRQCESALRLRWRRMYS